MSEPRKFLIIGSRNYANRRLLYEFKQKGAKVQIIDPIRLLPYVNDTKSSKKDVMYVATRSDKPKWIKKQTLSAIVPRIGGSLQFYAHSVEHLNKNIEIPSTADADALLIAQDKILTTQRLSQDSVRTPKTFAIKKPANLKWVIEQMGGFPVVAKLIFGSQGIGIFILTEALSASTALDAFSSQGHALLMQQFIETSNKDIRKHDFRAVVVDGKVVASIKRYAVGDDFRTNASLKEDCEGVELDDEMKKIAIQAAKAVGLACAGVDLAKEVETGKIYCYEVNGNFNFKSTEKYSKKNVAKEIVEYSIRLAEAEEERERKQKEKEKKDTKSSWFRPFGESKKESNKDDEGCEEYDEFSSHENDGLKFGHEDNTENDDNAIDSEERTYLSFLPNNELQAAKQQHNMQTKAFETEIESLKKSLDIKSFLLGNTRQLLDKAQQKLLK
jgi:ribosomal protein S6--L-glutamate ligase